MWPSEKKLNILYRSGSSQFFCKFRSLAGFLNFQSPTLRNNDGSVFEIVNNYIMLNGEYLNVTYGNNISFFTSSRKDIVWQSPDGKTGHLYSNIQKRALDVYEIGSTNVVLWNKNESVNQKWEKIDINVDADIDIDYHIVDNTGSTSVFFPIAEPTTTNYRGKNLNIDNFIFFSKEVLLHDKYPQVRMPALLITHSTYRQIVLDPSQI